MFKCMGFIKLVVTGTFKYTEHFLLITRTSEQIYSKVGDRKKNQVGTVLIIHAVCESVPPNQWL